jgi:hypothetical protein
MIWIMSGVSPVPSRSECCRSGKLRHGHAWEGKGHGCDNQVAVDSSVMIYSIIMHCCCNFSAGCQSPMQRATRMGRMCVPDLLAAVVAEGTTFG